MLRVQPLLLQTGRRRLLLLLEQHRCPLLQPRRGTHSQASAHASSCGVASSNKGAACTTHHAGCLQLRGKRCHGRALAVHLCRACIKIQGYDFRQEIL